MQPMRSTRWRRVHAIRGATTVEVDEPTAILTATRALLEEIVERNEVDIDDIVSVLFSATADLTSAFPARAARELGWTECPLMCMSEIAVPGSLARCIRVLVHVEYEQPRERVMHVYQRGAEELRPDLVGVGESRRW